MLYALFGRGNAKAHCLCIRVLLKWCTKAPAEIQENMGRLAYILSQVRTPLASRLQPSSDYLPRPRLAGGCRDSIRSLSAEQEAAAQAAQDATREAAREETEVQDASPAPSPSAAAASVRFFSWQSLFSSSSLNHWV